MPKELAKQYAPQGTEDRIYQNWCDKGYFHTQIDRSKKPFTIVMPPPNVTGQLHMGHAMDETWQDILTRYKRMQGYAALWVPGTDHAGIATQIKVEEEHLRQPHRQPAEKAGLLLRLAARTLHDGRGLLQRRQGSVRPPVQ